MKKAVKILLGIFGISLVSGIVIRERKKFADLRKRLFDMRYYEPRH